MTDAPSLREVIADAIGAYCAEHGFGIPNGFVYCVSRIDSDGDSVLTLGAQENQHTATSLGLSRYLFKKFDSDVVDELENFFISISDDDEDD